MPFQPGSNFQHRHISMLQFVVHAAQPRWAPPLWLGRLATALDRVYLLAKVNRVVCVVRPGPKILRILRCAVGTMQMTAGPSIGLMLIVPSVRLVPIEPKPHTTN